ncbi:hypothetical protein T492DRAFT_199311 [Pavlovales sp. CCMP2436]|nr:hypothetical protein T492DRAFT_199311 [Pavlovales sp. CCMP2436]
MPSEGCKRETVKYANDRFLNRESEIGCQFPSARDRTGSSMPAKTASGKVVATLKVADLRAELEILGLPTDGLKAALCARLDDALAAGKGKGKAGKEQPTPQPEPGPEPEAAQPTPSPAPPSNEKKGKGKAAKEQPTPQPKPAPEPEPEPEAVQPTPSPAPPSTEKKGKGNAAKEQPTPQPKPKPELESEAVQPTPSPTPPSAEKEKGGKRGKRKADTDEPSTPADAVTEPAGKPTPEPATEPPRPAERAAAPQAEAALPSAAGAGPPLPAGAPVEAVHASAGPLIPHPPTDPFPYQQLQQAGEWVAKWDPNHRTVYYFNSRTNESTWTAPPALAHPRTALTGAPPVPPAQQPAWQQQPGAKRAQGPQGQRGAVQQQASSDYRMSYSEYMARTQQPGAPVS